MRILPLAAVALIAACTPAQQAKIAAFNAKTQTTIQAVVAKAYADGQLFCQFATTKGPTIVGVVNAAVTVGAEVAGAGALALPVVSVINQSSAWVVSACQKAADALGATAATAMPVPPPADPTTVLTVPIVPPPA